MAQYCAAKCSLEHCRSVGGLSAPLVVVVVGVGGWVGEGEGCGCPAQCSTTYGATLAMCVDGMGGLSAVFCTGVV